MDDRTKKVTKVKKSRQQRGFDRTREKILSAAIAVFSEKGLTAPVDEITRRADVARGSFYYHFKNKDSLIKLLMEEIISELIERMDRECLEKEGLESTLDGIIQAHISFFSDRWQHFVLYYQGRADLTLEDSYDGIEKPFLKYAKSIEKLIDFSVIEPISDGRLRRVANAIAGFVSGYYSFASVASVEQDIDKEFRSLRKAFVASLARFTRDALPDNEMTK
ncbi:MAG: TetR/AcrR family transcriptional regulator [Candidatus Zixiibacteriota bacterium]